MTDSFPVSNVENEQPAGIGRVVALRDGCAWNNLGRNIVFADAGLRPTGIFGETEYPEDPVTSEYDLDVHAVVEVGPAREVAALNHLGLLRVFDRPPGDGAHPGPPRPGLRADRVLRFIGDIERIVGVDGRLVTSRPRGERLPGVLVSDPVASARDTLGASSAEESFGLVTALAAGAGWVALGGEGRVRVLEMTDGHLGRTLWESPVDLLAAVIAESGDSLWVAGSALGGTDLDDYDWDGLVGGGLAQLDLRTGEVRAGGRLAADLAWGSGGVPFAVVGGAPVGIDRRGGLHSLRPGSCVTEELRAPFAPSSLGIAHAAPVAGRIVFGFNRGGYRLHSVAVPPFPPGRRA